MATIPDLRRSVISVPPLARGADERIAPIENARLLAHLRSGGVTTFMYGGNANINNMAVSELPELLDMLEELAEDGDWFIPPVGSDFGKALDQVRILRSRSFPTAVALPSRSPATPAGVASGIRRLADAYGKPLIAYVRDAGYLRPEDLGKLAADGAICGLKYAVVLEDPSRDPYLERILAAVDPGIVISGIGERPVIDHFTRFGVRAFTSGSACVAPRLSTMVLEALTRGDAAAAARLRQAFIPLEDLRDAQSPIRVLHEAVRLAGIAETGPMQPFLSNITEPQIVAAIEVAAKRLLEANGAHAPAAV